MAFQGTCSYHASVSLLEFTKAANGKKVLVDYWHAGETRMGGCSSVVEDMRKSTLDHASELLNALLGANQ